MRQPDEATQIIELGSIMDLTQATPFGRSGDQLTWVPPTLGDRNHVT